MNSPQSIQAKLKALSPQDRAKLIGSLSPDEQRQLEYCWPLWARPNQLPPQGQWRHWLLLAGRGFGKTRVGAEFVKERVASGKGKTILIAAPTFLDLNKTIMRGPSGILSVYPENDPMRPEWIANKGLLQWPNGAYADCISAEKPDRFRGGNYDTYWADELACWRYTDSWDQLCLAFRSPGSQGVVTTTPKPTDLIRKLYEKALAGGGYTLTKGSTYDNAANLDPDWIKELEGDYANTNLGRQELFAEILDNLEGALWTRDLIEVARVQEAPRMARIVVAVDPATTSNGGSDETGIVVSGLGVDRQYYVIDDVSGKYSPSQWAKVVVETYRKYKADRVVAETNQGGDLVTENIRNYDPTIPIRTVHTMRGKALRAEPISALYEQHKVHHVGVLPLLEAQMCSWVPGVSAKSPDRCDALCYSLAELSGRTNASYQPLIHIPSSRAYFSGADRGFIHSPR